jgi:hypothetical protein
VPFAEIAVDDHCSDLLGEPQQPQGIGDRGAVLSDALGERILRVAMFFEQMVESLCELDGVQVFALNVLDEGKLIGCAGRNVADYDQNLVKTRALSSPPATFAGHDFEAIGVGQPPNDQRFEDTMLSDRVG